MLPGLLLGLDVLFLRRHWNGAGRPFLNAAFNFCLGCEMYLLFADWGGTQAADTVINNCTISSNKPIIQVLTQTTQGEIVSRESALVSADWVE